MNNITLTIEEANTLLGYLAKQPYGEVAGLIQMISVKGQNAQTQEEIKPKSKKNTEKKA